MRPDRTIGSPNQLRIWRNGRMHAAENFVSVVGHKPINEVTEDDGIDYGWVHDQPWTQGSPNFAVLLKWNEAEVYAKTVAYFATKLGEQP